MQLTAIMKIQQNHCHLEMRSHRVMNRDRDFNQINRSGLVATEMFCIEMHFMTVSISTDVQMSTEMLLHCTLCCVGHYISTVLGRIFCVVICRYGLLIIAACIFMVALNFVIASSLSPLHWVVLKTRASAIIFSGPSLRSYYKIP